MDVSITRGRLRTPEECVALLRFKAIAMVMAAGSTAIVAVMLGLAWRVMVR